MACPACHALLSREVRSINRSDHLYHPARCPFLWNGIDHKVCFVAAGAGMAICAVITQSGSHHSHGCNEIVDGEFLESAGCNVLKSLSSLARSCSGRRTTPLCRNAKHQSKTTRQPDRYRGCHHQPQPELHVYFLRKSQTRKPF